MSTSTSTRTIEYPPETLNPAQQQFRALTQALASIVTRRERSVAAAESLERSGHHVIWFKGLPLPDLRVLTDTAEFTQWLENFWTEPERASVAQALPGFLASWPTRLALMEDTYAHRAHSCHDHAVRDEIDEYQELLMHLDEYFARIAENCLAVASPES